MATSPILVQMESRPWTCAALSQACQEAKASGASIVLVKLLPDDYLAWLCDDCNAYIFTEADTADIRAYEALAAEYGVPLTVRVFQYHNLEQGIVKAADELNAETVFAVVPPSAIPFMHDAPLRHLEHELHEHHHQLHAVEVAIP